MSSAEQNKYHPIQSSLNTIESVGSQIYSKYTPAFVDSIVKENAIISGGTATVVRLRHAFDPLIDLADSYASSVFMWGLEKYQQFFYNNLMKVVNAVKDFYSSENNDYARITLRFLTLAIPNPDYLSSVYQEKFVESFKYDPQYQSERFQKILQTFFKNAKETWTVNRLSKPLEIVKNSLQIVASTMEELQIAVADRVPHFSQKMADYFVNDTPNRNLFSRKHFRQYFKLLLHVDELDENMKTLSDQYVQIASVLFDLTSMSNKDVINWTVHTIKFTEAQVKSVFETCNAGIHTVLDTASTIGNLTKRQVTTVATTAMIKATEIFNIGKDGVITVYHNFVASRAIKRCLEMAHTVDLFLRQKGKYLIEALRRNKQAFRKFLIDHKEELITYATKEAIRFNKYSKDTRQKALKFIREQEENATDTAQAGKDVLECVYDLSADFLLDSKERLSTFVVTNFEVLREESKEIKNLVFHKLKLEEIGTFVLKTVRHIEEYFCIKESLSRLDLLTNKCVTEVEQRHLLSPVNHSNSGEFLPEEVTAA